MRRKWAILICIVHIVVGVWSGPIGGTQSTSDIDVSKATSSPVAVASPSSLKPPVETEGNAISNNLTTKAVTDIANKTASEAVFNEQSNPTESVVGKGESDTSKDLKSTVIGTGGSESENVVINGSSPQSEVSGDVVQETQPPPDHTKVPDKDVKEEDKGKILEDVGKKAFAAGTLQTTVAVAAAAEGESEPDVSGAAMGEGDKVTDHVKSDSPTTAQGSESSQASKVEATVAGAADDNAVNFKTLQSDNTDQPVEQNISKPLVEVQHEVQDDTKAPSEEITSMDSADTKNAFSSVSDEYGSMGGSMPQYSESYDTHDNEEYEDQRKLVSETQKGGLPVSTMGQFTDDADSHFFAYFLTIMVTAIIFYLVFHNKQRIFALIIEGRSPNGGRTRRSSSRAKYHKLDNNLEEAITATKGTNGC